MSSLNKVVPLNLKHLNPHENVTVRSLSRRIRCAEETDNPELIIEYLKLSDNINTTSKASRRDCLLAQYQLLIETMSDKCLPIHWRCLCLDHIYRPLFALQSLVMCEDDRQHLRLLFHQVKIVGNNLQEDLYA